MGGREGGGGRERQWRKGGLSGSVEALDTLVLQMTNSEHV